MATAQDVLAAAQARLGLHEQPPGSNRVPGITDYVEWWANLSDSQRQWCDMFVSVCFASVGIDNISASCWASIQRYEDGTFGSWIGKPDIAEVRPGDQSFYGGGGADHTGLVAAVNVAERQILTYEGNWGNQSLGLWRDYDDSFVFGFGRPNYDGVPVTPQAPTPQAPAEYTPPSAGGENPYTPLYVDGVFGPLSVSALQWSLNDSQVADMDGASPISVDGEAGPSTWSALQRYLGVAIDGDFRTQSTEALQSHVGVNADGEWGPITSKALQKALNNKTF